MKKVLIFLIVVLLVLTTVFAFSCSKEEEVKDGYTIVSPDGAPALALASMIQNNQLSDGIKVVPSVVSSTLIKSEAVKSDFAIVPANMASLLYNAGEDYLIVGAVTNGNMFFVSNKENTSFVIEDLIGHVMYSIGQGSVPAFIMMSIIKHYNIEYVISETPVEGKVAIHFVDDGQALIAKVKTATETVYGNLAEPAVTNLVSKGFGYRVADVQELWQTVTSSYIKGFAQAVLIAKRSICEANPELVEAVINSIKKSETDIISNPQTARDAIASIYPETTLPQTLPAQIAAYCNVHMHLASVDSGYILDTLRAAKAINSKSVGGNAIAFYY